MVKKWSKLRHESAASPTRPKSQFIIREHLYAVPPAAKLGILLIGPDRSALWPADMA
jgi:hypothetical protein